MNNHIYDKAFITGCDKNTQWMLDWFLDGYYKHNDTPIIFADFGITETYKQKLQESKKFHCILNFKEKKVSGWFLKPIAMFNSPSIKTVWLDTDIEILGDISGIFDELVPGKLSMVEDKAWTKRRPKHGTWHNSGVVGFINKPQILSRWARQVVDNPRDGDQEVLYNMLDQIEKMTYINDLHNKYNVTRLQHLDKTVPREILMNHWTGYKGKLHIADLIDNTIGE